MKKDRIVGIISLVLGIAALIGTFQIPVSVNIASSSEPGPRLFPMLASILLVICGIGLLIKTPGEDTVFLTKEQWKRYGKLFLAFLAYYAGLYLVGFVVSTPIILFVMMTMFAGPKKPSLVIRLLYSVGIALILFLAFEKLFKFPLPSGLLLKAIF